MRKNTKEPVKEPVNRFISLSIKERFNLLKQLYSEPKIYRATEIIDGKKLQPLKSITPTKP